MSEVCAVNHIDHIGIAVRDIDAALEFFGRVFGTPPAAPALLPDQGVRAALIQIGQTRLELLEPTDANSAVGRFIDRRGEGLHHLALNVDGIGAKLQLLDAQGLRLIDHQPRHGLSGTIAFIHPTAVFGVLTELVETVPPPEC